MLAFWSTHAFFFGALLHSRFVLPLLRADVPFLIQGVGLSCCEFADCRHSHTCCR